MLVCVLVDSNNDMETSYVVTLMMMIRDTWAHARETCYSLLEKFGNFCASVFFRRNCCSELSSVLKFEVIQSAELL
jgi:hypothetical protein